MVMKTVDVRDAPSQLDELFTLVASGAEVVFTRGSTPVARLVPMTSGIIPGVAGLHPGAITTSADFDAPLPLAFWTGSQ